MQSDLHVTIARLAPEAHVASLVGELDAATAPLLLRRLQPVAGRGRSQLIVDLCGVTFADGAAVAALGEVAERLARNGGALLIATDDPRLRRLFEPRAALDPWQLERTLAEAVERVVSHQYA